MNELYNQGIMTVSIWLHLLYLIYVGLSPLPVTVANEGL